MASVINTNLAAIGAQRNLNCNSIALNKNLEKLSSGLKINTAGDDAAGMAISERMRAQLGGLKAAVSNTNEGIALIQTADGALSGINSMLIRMRELAVRAANGTLDSVACAINQSEVTALLANITATVGVTQYSGITLLDGTANINFQIGANDTINDRRNLSILPSDTASIGVDQVDVSTNENARDAIATIDAGIIYIANNRALIGAAQNAMERTQTNLGISIENAAASLSNILDADMAEEMLAFTKNNVLSQAAQSMLSNANQMSLGILKLLGA